MIYQLPVFFASDPLLPIRVLAGAALFAVIATFVYVLLHLRKIEQKLLRNGLVPNEIGPRDNLLLMICLIPIIVVSILFFLVLKA